jgi:hypothetical protein
LIGVGARLLVQIAGGGVVAVACFRPHTPINTSTHFSRRAHRRG